MPLAKSDLVEILAEFFDLDEFLNVSSALPPPPPTTSSLSALNAFGADKPDDPVVFNIEVSGAAILLKPRMKRR